MQPDIDQNVLMTVQTMQSDSFYTSHFPDDHKARTRAVVVATRAVDRIVLARLVALAGTAVLEAEPAEAAAMIARSAPHVVVIDTGPQDDVHRAILKDLEKTGGSRIVIVSSSMEAAAAVLSEPGVHAAVCKPVTTDKLLPVVRRVIGEAGRA